MLKDRYGFMWFGTMDGLNRYDGYRFKIYRNDPKDRFCLPNNQIKSIYEDRDGDLWIGTMGGGLVRYNRNNDSFIHVIKPSTDRNMLDISVNAILEDSKGNFWVGTYSNLYLLDKRTYKLNQFVFKDVNGFLTDAIITAIFEDSRQHIWIGTKNGLYQLNKEKRTVRHFKQSNKPGSLSNDQVNTICEDDEQQLWIGTYDGLNRYNHRTNTFSVYKKVQNDQNSISNNVVLTLCKAIDNQLWVGTEEALELFDYKKEIFTHHRNNTGDEESLNHNSIHSLLQDNQGILWIGTFAGGINKYDQNHTYFQLFKSFHITFGGSSSAITSFAENTDGDVWIGTDGGSLNLWKRETNEFVHYNPNDKNGFDSFSVLSLLLSKDKRSLWIGTYERGLRKLDIKTNTFSYYYKGDAINQISNNTIYAIAEDRYGNIWLGTNGDGVNILEKDTGTIIKYKAKNDPGHLNNNYIRAFYEDKMGNMWIATYGGGLNIYNPDLKSFTNFNRTNSNLQSDIINIIYGDSGGDIWVGTIGGGLLRFDQTGKNITVYTEEDGLPSNIVNSIFEDDHKQLWVSTNNGVSKLALNGNTFSNYGLYNGLQGNEFFKGAGLKTSSGEILFGGINGFNVFDTSSIKHNRNTPPIIFTDFQLFNKPVLIGAQGSPLKQNINEITEIELSHDQSVFTIEFAALGYTIPENNQYAYLLEGFDKEWNYVGNNRRATYTNLDAGTYLFKVRAANNDGIWNPTEASLKISITPPIWRTGWAYLIYILTIAFILYILYLEVKSRERLKNEVLFERLSAKKNDEINKLKVNFFTNISHELRTPLSLILDPLRKIIYQDISLEQAKRYGQLAYKNAERLLRLVNQLLDFRRLETGVTQFKAHKINLFSLINEITETFVEHAAVREIDLSIEFESKELIADLDEDKFEKILCNLLSNAFKFTDNGGKIRIVTKVINGIIEIHIIDSGLGIPEEELDKIFDIFYKVDSTSPFENKSTGIGLALTKELVEMHGGKIIVSSKLGYGSDFTICLPLRVDKTEAPILQEPSVAVPQALIPVATIANALPGQRQDNTVGDKPILLLIEDNIDLRSYIYQELSPHFQVSETVNGVEGLETARQLIPDLIISDIMMPVMDGLTLCKHIKSDERTSHIPLILLTAKQTDDNKIEGFTQGADAYIVKPFTMDLLIVRINNLLDSRRKLRELFAKNTVDKIDLQDDTFTHIDRDFLRKVQVLIEENFNHPNFNVDFIAQYLQMSRRQLYRKIKALTNQSVQEFIITISLKKARTLLLTGEFTISEIAYKVGFSEPSNFSRSFTKFYGMSPKNYLDCQKRHSK